MKKKLYAFLLTTLAIGISLGLASAQPVLGPDYLPTLGTVISISSGQAVSIANTDISLGANQTWNYTLSQNLTFGYEVMQSSTTPYASYFPLADYAYRVIGPLAVDGYIYFASTQSGFYEVGVAQSGSISTLSPFFVYLPYGGGLNTSRYDTTYYKHQGSNSFSYHQADTTTVVGYGTLTINQITYPNSILLKINTVRRDSGSSNTSTTTSYRWFAPGVGYPVLIFIKSQGSLDTYSVNYLNSVSTSVSANLNAGLQLSPNPATNLIYVNTKSRTATAIATDGKRYPLPIQAGHADVSTIPPGA